MLYVLLGDRNGVSYLIHANIATLLDVGVDEYLEVRQSLEDKDLIATADFGTRVQVLSLPCRPVAPPQRVRTAPMAQAPTKPPPVEAPNHEQSISILRDILRSLDR